MSPVIFLSVKNAGLWVSYNVDPFLFKCLKNHSLSASSCDEEMSGTPP